VNCYDAIKQQFNIFPCLDRFDSLEIPLL